MKIFQDQDYYYLKLDNGDDYEVLIDYDYSPPQKKTMTDPAFDAEFEITSVRLSDNDFEINLDWIENLEEFEKEQLV